MNNEPTASGEPVAWMQTWENQDGELKHTVNIEQIGKQDIPLYTHPAKTLTGAVGSLSDEEILDICIMGGFYDRIDDPFFDKKTGAWSLDEDLIEFGRAILRKAQEK